MKTNEIQLLEVSEIAGASTDQLKQEFAKSLKITADRLAYMASIYSELTSRGVDMSGIKGGLMEYMPLIASDQLDARLVIEYAGNKTLLSYLAKLAKDKQLALIENPVVKVVSIGDNDEKEVQDVSLDSIRAGQIFQVFDANAGSIRDEEEQYKQLLVKSSNKKKGKSKNRRVNKVKLEGDYIVVKGMDISIKAVLEALGERDGVDYFRSQQG
ncbi:MAG: hypothetical protein ACTIJH_07520 [Moraxellaceae bacterium]